MNPETIPAANTARPMASLPCVSVILPFEPKMSAKKDLEYRLQRVMDKAGNEMAKSYSEMQYQPVIDRLKLMIKRLDYTTYMQSIVLFASPAEEKMYYLNIPMEEKIAIDTRFGIRDLVRSKKDIHRYLVLVLAGNHSQVFLADPLHFICIASYRPRHVAACRHEMPERVANFSDPQNKREIMMEKFLRYVDDGLGMLLKAYPLPLFVLGVERTVGHFNKLSHHAQQVCGYAHGNFEEAGECVVRKAIAPLVADWKKIKQQALLQRVNNAANAHKFISGIAQVCKEAGDKKGRLLLVETNFNNAAVNGVIEAVLANGGDVEFMDDDVLKDYERIALIKYY